MSHKTPKAPLFAALILAAGARLAAASDLSNAFAFPVPFVPSKQAARAITFQNLSSSGRIRIFTLQGKLVREIDFGGGGGQAAWDAKTSDGRDAASGTYIYVIEGGGDVKKGALVIVR